MSGTTYSAALDRVLELTVLINDDMNQSLAKDGLTTARAHVLWVLAEHGPTTQRVLAEALAVTPRTVTSLVDAMTDAGLVTREPHPTDRRATLVTPTRRGARLAAAMKRDQDVFARLLFEGMPARRFDALVAGLDELLARLRAAGVTRSQAYAT
jgi:DNA-binding MarR family transcriptional regulator